MKRANKEALLKRLKELMDHASTRGEAYAMVAAEFGRTVGAIKMMASREGLTSWSHSLHFSFSEKDERDFVAV